MIAIAILVSIMVSGLCAGRIVGVFIRLGYSAGKRDAYAEALKAIEDQKE